MWKQTLTAAGAAALLGISGIAAAESPGGNGSMHDQQTDGRYSGFAKGNPELPYDGDGEPGINPVPAENPSRKVDEATVYPEGVGKELRVDVPNEPPPYSEEADVHGAFGANNPNLQR